MDGNNTFESNILSLQGTKNIYLLENDNLRFNNYRCLYLKTNFIASYQYINTHGYPFN